MTAQELMAAKIRGALTLEDAAAVLEKYTGRVDLAAECLGDILTALKAAREGYEIIGDTMSMQVVDSTTRALTDIRKLLGEN